MSNDAREAHLDHQKSHGISQHHEFLKTLVHSKLLYLNKTGCENQY